MSSYPNMGVQIDIVFDQTGSGKSKMADKVEVYKPSTNLNFTSGYVRLASQRIILIWIAPKQQPLRFRSYILIVTQADMGLDWYTSSLEAAILDLTLQVLVTSQLAQTHSKNVL